ncbi:MAG: hypothetical protein JWR09_4209 [Mucilaginibacter sp.]|nr:hypothetical protein [Mucilaginibacter sp.]
MLKFNPNGLLIPDTNIKSDVNELEDVFVKDINTSKRIELFNNYAIYSRSLKELCNNSNLIQWIDGSFVTQKSEPNDIDIVTFIDFEIVDELNDKLINYKCPASKNLFGVDAYLVKLYPKDHKYYPICQADWAYWMDHFNKTRRNRIGNKLQKGFLEINM